MLHTTTWEFTLYRRVAVTWAASSLSCSYTPMMQHWEPFTVKYLSQRLFDREDLVSTGRPLCQIYPVAGRVTVGGIVVVCGMEARVFMRHLMGSKQQVRWNLGRRLRHGHTDACRHRQRRNGGNRHSQHHGRLVCINIPDIHHPEVTFLLTVITMSESTIENIVSRSVPSGALLTLCQRIFQIYLRGLLRIIVALMIL